MKILLTGFEPFGGSKINPSEQVVNYFRQHSSVPCVEIVTGIIPVDRYQAPQKLYGLLEHELPDAVICLGEAGKRVAISIERVAINLMDFRIADNSGNIAEDLPVVDGGPAAYFSTLPVRTLQTVLRDAKIPVEISLTAGTYLCNQVMYSLLHKLCVDGKLIPAGFIHLPLLPEQASEHLSPEPSMSLEMMVSALELIMRKENYISSS